MTPQQRKMARHALGLDVQDVSYRNHYAAGIGSTQEAAWESLVESGLAERGIKGIALSRFHLTEKGAVLALSTGEKLDREDFPGTEFPPQDQKSKEA